VASFSRRLKRLLQRERMLRAHILGPPASWGAPPGDQEIDLALGYRVLAHAEIERYLEELVSATLASCEQLIFRGNDLRLPAFAAIVLHQAAQFGDGKADAWTDVRPSAVVSMLPTAISAARSWVEKTTIANNNGLKPGNVTKLLGHIGIARRDLDPTLLEALKVFGGERGDAAHLSRREIRRRLHRGSPAGLPRVIRLASPSDEVARVGAVLALLPQLDRQVTTAFRTTV
jgi:hypothetical protein